MLTCKSVCVCVNTLVKYILFSCCVLCSYQVDQGRSEVTQTLSLILYCNLACYFIEHL